MKIQQSKRSVMVFIGLLVSMFFLLLAIQKVDIKSLGLVLSSVRYPELAGSALLLSAGVVLRSHRWRTVAGESGISQPYYFRATVMGLFSNLVFPLRVGEFVRVLTLAKLSNSPLTVPVTSALFDRIIDMIVLLISVIVLYVLSPVGGIFNRWLIIMLFSGVALIFFLKLYAKYSVSVEKFIYAILKSRLNKFTAKSEIFLTDLKIVMRDSFRKWFSFWLLIIIVFILIADYSAFTLLLYAFHLKLPLEAPFVLWVFLSASSALPSAPGYFGVYQLAAVMSLSFYFVPPSVAVAIATMLQLTMLLIAIIMAGPGAWNICKNALKTTQ